MFCRNAHLLRSVVPKPPRYCPCCLFICNADIRDGDLDLASNTLETWTCKETGVSTSVSEGKREPENNSATDYYSMPVVLQDFPATLTGKKKRKMYLFTLKVKHYNSVF